MKLKNKLISKPKAATKYVATIIIALAVLAIIHEIKRNGMFKDNCFNNNSDRCSLSSDKHT